MPEYLFKAKISKASYIKGLIELLGSNLKKGLLKITADGIFLRQWNEDFSILFDLELSSENFPVYKYNLTDDFPLGLTLQQFYKALKSVKKSDSIILFISSDKPTILRIRKIPKDKGRITTFGIIIQNIQNIDASIPTGYGKPIVIPPSEFQKTYKDLCASEPQQIKITTRSLRLDFTAISSGSVIDTECFLGEFKDSDDENSDIEDDSDQEKIVEATFNIEHLFKIVKMSGLEGDIMQIYAGNEDLPFLFKTTVGPIGKISAYVKSLELMAKEKTLIPEDDDDYTSRISHIQHSIDNVEKPKKASIKKQGKSVRIFSDDTDDSDDSCTENSCSISKEKPGKKKAAGKKNVGRPRLK